MNRKKVLVLINPNSGKKNSKESVLDALNVFLPITIKWKFIYLKNQWM